MIAEEKILENIPKVVSIEVNKALKSPTSLEEVISMLFNMHLDSSPCPDGFQAFFVQKCWDIIRIDLWKAIQASRNGGSLLSEINNTFLTLIPQKNDPEIPRDFRPIVLCNTTYKIISKILANRMKPILHNLILEEQTSFVSRRSILDGILIIQETL